MLPLWPGQPLFFPPEAPAPPRPFGQRLAGATLTRGDLRLLPSVPGWLGLCLGASWTSLPGSACLASHFFSCRASLDSPSLARVNSQRKSSLPRQFYFLINSAPFGNCFPSAPSPVLPPEASVTCSQLTFPHEPLLFLPFCPDPPG